MEAVKDYIKNINPSAERRFACEGIQMRAGTEDSKPSFRGYAAKFNTLSNDLGGFRERIAPGFFDKVLAHDVRVLKNHNPDWVLGRTKNGTARIGVDEIGLWYEYTDPDTSYSRDLMISIERKDIDQSSFAFIVENNGDKWEKQKDGAWIRTLFSASDLFDVSPVTYPAYEDTSVASRSLSKLQIPEGITEALADYISMENEIAERELTKIKKSIKN